jgi:pimeloyl-ACP methyl ester carboxylesterase
MRPRQHVRYLKASDGTQLAWAESGAGPIVVKAANWRTHLEYDIEDLLPQVRTPTLVLHARKDEVVPISEGRLLASGILGSEFVELDSSSHVLLEREPAWQRGNNGADAAVRPKWKGFIESRHGPASSDNIEYYQYVI